MAEALEISQSPVDPLHIASHVSIKLTGENYLLWKSELLPVLKTYDLFNIIHGKELCPPKYMSANKSDENPAYTNWRRKDRACRTFIYATLSEDLWPLLKSCSRRAHAMWLKLEEEFVSITIPRTRLLKTRLFDLKKGKLTMEKYLKVAEEIADGLEVVGCPVEVWDYAAHVLRGLPSDYDAFAASILARDTPVTREELFSLLLSEEKIVYRRRQLAAIRMTPDAAVQALQKPQQRPDADVQAVQQPQQRPWHKVAARTSPDAASNSSSSSTWPKVLPVPRFAQRLLSLKIEKIMVHRRQRT